MREEAISDRSNDRHEKLFALYFLVGICILAGIWFIPSRHPASVRVAAIGGSLSFFGVILMALPVIRVGPFAWISHLYFPDIERESGSTEFERREFEDKRRFDLFVQNILGPYLIGIGTLLNGISGFF
jgi:hypothetical protein